GKTLLSDLCRILGCDDEEFADVEGDADTLAGLLLEIKGDFLSVHEKLFFKHYTFEVMEIDGMRISKVKVVIENSK
ncbi:MAG: hemolysin, partial [Prevotella sp.]|nr:hemolysin [Prevotella sp.]